MADNPPLFTPAPGTLPAGARIYAVGDIHGCDHRLEALHALIAADLAARPIANPLLLHLGDYVDRGPDSRAVLTRLATGAPIPGLPTINLTGNHEQMMLQTLASLDPDDIENWIANGGEETLRSWNLNPFEDPETWPAAIDPAHLAFMRNLKLTHRVGDYLFVHAGIRPGIALAEQAREDLLWIREPFLSHDDPLEAIVVHGHTPIPAPLVRPNRIDIDTGAYLGGDLTCAILEADFLAFLQA